MKNLATYLLTVAALGSLSACGGGGSGTGIVSFDKDAAIKLTGSTAPQETITDQDRRFSAARTQIDTYIASGTHGETNDPDIPTFQQISNCRGTTCIFTDIQSGAFQTVDFADPPGEDTDQPDTGQQRAVLTKNGITLYEIRGGTGGPNARDYGAAWMDHGGFGVLTKYQSTVQDTLITRRVALAIGDSTRTRPSSNATWVGVMVGTPARGSRRDNILQGDVTLTYRSLGQDIDAAFTNIKDLDRNASHSVSQVRFDDVSVGTDGNYIQKTAAGNYIQGGFFGPNHAETGGVFEKRGIIGSFGAKKQP